MVTMQVCPKCQGNLMVRHGEWGCLQCGFVPPDGIELPLIAYKERRGYRHRSKKGDTKGDEAHGNGN